MSVIIKSVDKGSPAYRAGLRGGETLLINLELFGRGNRGKDRSREHDKEKNCKQFSHFEKSFFF